MSINNQGPIVFNFQSTSPVVGFFPYRGFGGSAPSGSASGSMSGTNTIYSQIFDLQKMDGVGLVLAWTGTPVGTISVIVGAGDNNGANFGPLTGFNPAITQPAGAAGTSPIQCSPLKFRYFYLQYTNTSGSGSLTAYGQQKD